MTINPGGSHAMSVFPGDEAAYFVKWINLHWSALTPEQQKTAKMECRPREKGGFAMVGFNWESSTCCKTAGGK